MTSILICCLFVDFSVCNNFPLIDVTGEDIIITPLGSTPDNPPFLEGLHAFFVTCQEPLVYAIDPNIQLTACESDGDFSQDDNPPACVQSCE